MLTPLNDNSFKGNASFFFLLKTSDFSKHPRVTIGKKRYISSSVIFFFFQRYVVAFKCLFMQCLLFCFAIKQPVICHPMHLME